MSENPGFWQRRRVLVTGGSGLLGSWLCRDLIGFGAEVISLSSSGRAPHRAFQVDGAGLTSLRCSLQDFQQLKSLLSEHAIDTVFHLAALSTLPAGQSDPRLAFETNTRGCWNLLEACRQCDRHIELVCLSSTRVYGTDTGDECTEDGHTAASHPYEVSKACADLMAQAYHRQYDMPVSIARCGNFFGGGDRHFSRIVPGTLRSIMLGEQPVVNSDGRAILEYSYVQDVVDACRLLGEQTGRAGVAGEVFNISSGYRLSVLALIEKILAASQHNTMQPKVLNKPGGGGSCPRIVTDKARRLLGWRSQYSLEEALEETVAWYRRNPDTFAESAQQEGLASG